MKKSFLNRAMAAAIAVPVALSQTVLFTSFAEDQVPITNVIDVNTFVNVPVEDSKVSPIKEVTKYEVYEKESIWNQKLKTVLNSLDGTVKELDTEPLFEKTGRFSDKWYTEIAKGATTATATIDGTDMILTFNVAFTQNEKDLLEDRVVDGVLGQSSHIQEEDLRKYITSDVLDTVKGEVKITVDTASLENDKSVSFKVEASTELGKVTTIEEVKEYVTNKIEAYRAELKVAAKKLVDEYKANNAAVNNDETKAQLADAEKLLNESIDEFVDNYITKVNNATSKANGYLDKEISRSYAEDNYNAVLKKALEAADARVPDNGTSKAAKIANKALDKAPETISEALEKSTVINLYTEVLKQLNSIANEKGAAIEITTADIAQIAESAYDVTVDAEEIKGALAGSTVCYLPDDITDADKEVYVEYVNNELKKDGITDKEVDTVTTEKKVELSGHADYNTLDGDATLSIKRIIYVTLKDVEETESESQDQSESESDTDKESESESDTDKESESESESDTGKESESESESDTGKESESESESESQDQFESESESDTDKESESESDTDKESESESDTDKESESESDTDKESESESDTDKESESESDTDKESESESDTDKESESESDTDKESESESDTDKESESESDTDKESESESDTDKESESESDTDKESESESDTDKESESESDTGKESESESDTDKESESESDTDKESESESESESQTPEEIVKALNLDVADNAEGSRNFYFSHDPRPFNAADLITSAKITKTVTVEDETTTEEIDVDMSKFRFGMSKDAYDAELSPQDIVAKYIADGQPFAYASLPLYIFYVEDDGAFAVAEKQVYVYIGVKGDANLDGVANAEDAGKVLIYAADFGADKNPSLYSSTNAASEAFAWFLADVTGESKVKEGTQNEDGSYAAKLDAEDAGYILIYAAKRGATLEGEADPDWGVDVLPEPWPLYTNEITTWIKENQ